MNLFISNPQPCGLSPLLVIMISLGFVIFCCFFCIRTYHFIKNKLQGKISSKELLVIKSISSLSHHGKLIVIEFGAQSMLLGVTKEHICCLAMLSRVNHQPENSDRNFFDTQLKSENRLKDQIDDASSV